MTVINKFIIVCLCVALSTSVTTGTVPNGWYYVKGVQSQKYLQVAGDSNKDGANVEISTGTGSSGQRWYFTRLSNGYYTIKSALTTSSGSSLMLDLANGSTNTLANIQVYSNNNLSPQQFILTEVQSGQYTIGTVPTKGAQVIEVLNQATTDHANVDQYTNYKSGNQLWYLEAISTGSSSSSSSGSTTTTTTSSSNDYPAQLVSIGVNTGSTYIGVSNNQPALTTVMNNLNTAFRFDYVSSGVFKIVNQATGLLLTASSGSVTLSKNSNSNTQYWEISSVANDNRGNNLYFKIVNKNTYTALTINSNRVTLASYTGSTAQKFVLSTVGLRGFGALGKDLNGNVKAGTIGGLLGRTVYVSNFSDLKKYGTSSETLTIVVTASISNSASYSKDGNGRYVIDKNTRIYLRPNKTIIGAYKGTSLYNVYFCTYPDSNYGLGKNIIIRNFVVSHDVKLNNDNMMDFYYGENMWIDHVTFAGHSAVNTQSLADWDKFLAFYGHSSYITVSDCQFGLHEYGVLLGYPADTVAAFNEYLKEPALTLANNYYKNTLTRAPGLIRYGYYHSLNNYVYNFDLGYTIHTAATLFAESNYYDAGSHKGSVVNDNIGQITELSGSYLTKANPYYTDSGSTLVNSQYNLKNIKSTACNWRPSSNYNYSPMSAAEAKSYAAQYAGSQTARSNYQYAVIKGVTYPSCNYMA